MGHIEDVTTRGDTLDVVVQEVDRDRGRIGLKLVAKHENGNPVQPEELTSEGRTPRRGPWRRIARVATAAAAAAAATVGRRD